MTTFTKNLTEGEVQGGYVEIPEEYAHLLPPPGTFFALDCNNMQSITAAVSAVVKGRIVGLRVLYQAFGASEGHLVYITFSQIRKKKVRILMS